MQKWLTRKNILILLAIFFILSMVPVLIMARYTLPFYDDYDYGYLTHQAFVQTGSFWEILKAAAKQAALSYESWQGTFSGIFFMALSPGIYSEALYPLGIYILIVLFCASVLIFLKVVLFDYLKMEKYASAITALLTLIIMFQFMVSRSEGLFWYNGGFYYTGFYSFALLMAAALLSSGKAEKKSTQIILGTISIVLAFLVGGSNYVCALTTAFAIAIFTAHRFLIAKKKWIFPLITLTACIAALVINGLAPGNQVRQARFESPGAVKSIIYSMGYGLQFLSKHIHLPIIMGFLLLLPFLYEAAKNTDYDYRFPGIISIVSYGLFASSFTPSFYALNKIGPPRTLNISFFVSILLLLANIFYWCGWIAKKGTLQIKFKDKKQGIFAKQVLAAVFLLAFFGGIIGLDLENKNSVTSLGAYHSLRNGEVYTFYKENTELIDALKDPGISDVIVKPYSVKPFFYYQNGLDPDPETHLNQSTARYYEKNSVISK